MSVLVAVLYAFSRLAAENEVTALKANGVSPWRLVSPAIVAGRRACRSLLLAFNDQVLPRANHQLKTLQDDISQTQADAPAQGPGDQLDRRGEVLPQGGQGRPDGAAGCSEVVIYDLADPMRRRTIYADSGAHRLRMRTGVDLDIDLYHGEMQEVATDKPTQLDRMFYDHDRIRGSGTSGRRVRAPRPTDSTRKGDREMSICEMQTARSGSHEQARRTTQDSRGARASEDDRGFAKRRCSRRPSRADSDGRTARCSGGRAAEEAAAADVATATLLDRVCRTLRRAGPHGEAAGRHARRTPRRKTAAGGHALGTPVEPDLRRQGVRRPRPGRADRHTGVPADRRRPQHAAPVPAAGADAVTPRRPRSRCRRRSQLATMSRPGSRRRSSGVEIAQRRPRPVRDRDPQEVLARRGVPHLLHRGAAHRAALSRAAASDS